MNCPKCNKQSRCFCKSCKARSKLPSQRAEKAKGDFVKCPYCRTWFHFDYIENHEYEIKIQNETFSIKNIIEVKSVYDVAMYKFICGKA